jgi:hypothetical protein
LTAATILPRSIFIDTWDVSGTVALKMCCKSQKRAFLCRTRRKCEPANTRVSPTSFLVHGSALITGDDDPQETLAALARAGSGL